MQKIQIAISDKPSAEAVLGEVCMAMLAAAIVEQLVAIKQLKTELMSKGEATELFAQLRSDGLTSALATIEQWFADDWFLELSFPLAVFSGR